MSYTRSNLYASRVYAEHPVALWSMDEPNYFVSLISQEEKQITESNWTFDNAVSSASVFTLSGYPFDDLDVDKIYLASASGSPIEYTLSLSSSVSYLNFDPNKSSVCVSNYVYIPGQTFISYIDIGFIVEGEEFYKRHRFLKTNIWEKISYTHPTSNNGFTPFVRVVFDPNVDANEEESSLYFNGVSIGQWSEPYNSVSTGIFTQNLPESIQSLIDFESNIECTVIDPYGFEDLDAGYITSLNNSLLGQLSGIPMVYGSSGNIKLNKDVFSLVLGGSSSSIYEESVDGGSSSSYYLEYFDGGDSYSAYYPISEEQYKNFPSLIFPGKGFLNQFGSNKSLTAEFWIRINPEKSTKTRIFGPLRSNDGIYVEKDFIKVTVGNYTKSYFIGKWYRPMLLHFCQSSNEIFLMINGEKVISIPIDSLNIETFPDESEDFLGFYTDSKIYLYEIDSFSIFPYVVAEQVAKKRYVFGQGVQEQENIIASNNGTLSYVDFPFSGYNSTVRYPDRTKWEDGFYNNVVTNSEGISLPQYQLPELIFNNLEDISEYEKFLISENFYKQSYEIQDEDYPFLLMDPTSTYLSNGSYGTIYFSRLNQTSYQTRSIHSILKTSENVSSKQSLLYISNNINTDSFEVFIESGNIKYSFNDSVLNSSSIAANSYFAVGIDFEKIEENFGLTIGSFFSRTEGLSLNFAGNQENVFLGKVFSLTINNDFFTNKDENLIFNSFGIAFKNFDESLFNYIGSYTLLPKTTNTNMFLDIGVSGYWENSIPLSYFGKNIIQSNGNLKYDLDLVQFNIDTPSSTLSKYNQISSEYENSLSTKSYITLQNISEIGKFVYTQFTNTEIIGMNKVLNLGDITSSKNTKFKVNDGTIIYPPKDISGFTNYYITVHIEISSKGINTENVRIRDMSLSSLSFDEGDFYSINTPAEGKFYPIVKNEDQYVFKRNVPVVIDTDSSPYLYLSGDSGIQVLPETDENLTKGIAIPINKDLKLGQEVVGLQMFLMYNESKIFDRRRTIGKIFSSNDSFDIVLVPEDDGKRAFFKIFDSKTGEQFLTAKSFLNGKLVTDIVIEPLEWNYISISLQESQITLDGIIAQIEIYSGVKVDSVASFIELDPLKQQLIVYDEWAKVLRREGQDEDEEWEYWSSSATWTEALNPQSLDITVLSLDGEELFNTYAGLSLGSVSDNSKVDVSFDSVLILNDADWDIYLV
jgi:hypothetical protein